MEWIIALLIWLAADDSEAAVERHRAAACAGLAYGAMHRPVAFDDAGEDELVEPGGEAVAPPKKRAVTRCVNGKCYITYE